MGEKRERNESWGLISTTNPRAADKVRQATYIHILAEILTTPDVLMYDVIVLNIIDKIHERLTKTTLIFTAVNVYVLFADFCFRKLLGGKLCDGKMKFYVHVAVHRNKFLYNKTN
jgi:hypothetical protein